MKNLCPEALLSFVDKVPVYTQESYSQHLEILSELDPFRHQFEKSNFISKDEQEVKTLKRLKTLVTHAYNNIPHYKDIYSTAGFEPNDFKTMSDFHLLPTISKADLKIIEKQVRSNPEFVVQFQSRTSGSTGIPLCLLNDRFRTRHWHLIRMMMFEDMVAGCYPNRWTYSIYYETFYLSHILGQFPTFTIGLNAEPQLVADHIRKLKPVIVSGVASQVLAISKYLEDAQAIGIRAFSTNSESSSSQERKRMEGYTGVPFLDEYSTEELGIIAWENRDGTYRVAEDTVYLELRPNPGSELLSVVGTDLWSFSMPRIRYQQGDYAEWAEEFPKVGPRKLKRILGRQDMILLSKTKGKIDPALIHEAIDQTLVQPNSGVEEFRVIQNSLDNIRLIIKCRSRENVSKTILERFQFHFSNLFGIPNALTTEFTDELPSLGTKRRCIVRNFELNDPNQLSL